MQLPKNYKVSKDWHLILISIVAFISLVDIFLQRSLDGGDVYSITSGILGFFFIAEIIARVGFKKTFIGYKYSFYLAIICIIIDIFIYLPS